MKKNILIITGTLGGGGAEKVLETTLNHFDYNSYNIKLLVYTYSENKNIPKDVDIKYITKNSTRFGVYFLHFKTLHDIYLRHKLNTIFSNCTFDTIISFSEGKALLCHSLLLKLGKRNISWVHCDISNYMWFKFMFKSEVQIQQIYSQMDQIICVSNAARNGFISRFGLSNKTSTIYNVIDKDLIRKKSLEFSVTKTRFTITTCGRFIDIKRFDRIIETAKILRNRYIENIEFWLIGQGPLLYNLQILTEKYNLTDIIKFQGFQTNPYPFIKASDILLVTSDTEAYPTVICEALSLGKIVISTPVPGCIELLKNNVGVITEFDNNKIADSIVSIIKDKKLKEYYETNSKLAGEKFSPKEIMRQIYSLIN